jgi:hypothetical protein
MSAPPGVRGDLKITPSKSPHNPLGVVQQRNNAGDAYKTIDIGPLFINSPGANWASSHALPRQRRICRALLENGRN